MFKKFKDKLAEEMKQSPARIQASMHQLAQAVVSPNIPNLPSLDLSVSNDHFSLADEWEDTAKNDPKKDHRQIETTSLSSNMTEMSRSSSINSLVSSDNAGLFPIFQNSSSLYNFQSDVEQSASETDDYLTSKMEQFTKEEMQSIFCKVQAKYCKYKGKYRELLHNYREGERIRSKLESLLVETQNKALRRIGHLKEQCQLEQQAKAHLEEALRNDIEEKDHIIDALNTKVKLLQTNSPMPVLDNEIRKKESEQNASHDLIQMDEEMEDVSSEVNHVDKELLAENNQLKNKLDKLENLISKYKESLKRSKDKIEEVEDEKYKIGRELESIKLVNEEKLEEMRKNFMESEEKIKFLNDEINELHKKEEESVISLAENKLKIHKELEIKEEQIKQLTSQLKNAVQLKDKTEENAHGKIYATIDQSNESVDKKKSENSTVENLINVDTEIIGRIDKNKIENEFLELNDKSEKRDSEISELKQEINNLQRIIEDLNDEIQQKTRMIFEVNQNSSEKQKILNAKIYECVIAFQVLKKNSQEMKNDVQSCKKMFENQFSDLNEKVYNILNSYEQKKNLINEEKNCILITELENLNFKVSDMNEALKKNSSLVEKIKLEKEELEESYHSLRKENEEEISRRENVIMSLSEEIGFFKEKCNNQEKQLINIHEEHKNAEENSLTKLEELKKSEDTCETTRFAYLGVENKEMENHFPSKISKILEENAILNTKILEYETILNTIKASENKFMENERYVPGITFQDLHENSDGKLQGDIVSSEKDSGQELMMKKINEYKKEMKSCEQLDSVKNEAIDTWFVESSENNLSMKNKVLNEKLSTLMDTIIAKNDLIDKLKIMQTEKNIFIESLKKKLKESEINDKLPHKNNILRNKQNCVMDIMIAKNDFINELRLGNKEKNCQIESLENKNRYLCFKLESLMDTVIFKNDYINELKLLSRRKKCEKKKMNNNNNRLSKKLQELTEIIVSKNDHIYKLKTIKEEKNNMINELRQKNSQLQAQVETWRKNGYLSGRFRTLMDSIVAKNDLIEKLKFSKKEKNRIIEDLMHKNQQFIEQTAILKNYDAETEILRIEQSKLLNMNNLLSKKNEELKNLENLALQKIEKLENSLAESDQMIANSKKAEDHLKHLCDIHQQEIILLKKNVAELETNVDIEKKQSAKIIDEKNKESEEKVMNLRSTIEKLQKQLEEAESTLINVQLKKSQAESVNESLRNELNKLEQQLAVTEEEQRQRMNQLVKELQAQINDKDQELQTALDKKFEHQKIYESDLIQQYKEQLQDFQVELTTKSEEIENLKRINTTNNDEELKKLTELVTRMRLDHEHEIEQIESKFDENLKEKNNKITELKKEFEKYKQEIELISEDRLKTTLASQQRELKELRKIVKIRHDTLEDSTEIEYLRNILYEYMMGKEPLVLAKVIAAVVKFDQEQTSKILKKEEDKLTLLGSLGLT